MAIHKACLSTGNKHGQLATAGAGADVTGSDSGSDSTQPSEPDVRKGNYPLCPRPLLCVQADMQRRERDRERQLRGKHPLDKWPYILCWQAALLHKGISCHFCKTLNLSFSNSLAAMPRSTTGFALEAAVSNRSGCYLAPASFSIPLRTGLRYSFQQGTIRTDRAVHTGCSACNKNEAFGGENSCSGVRKHRIKIFFRRGVGAE